MKTRFFKALVGIFVPFLGPVVGLGACSAIMSFYMNGVLLSVVLGALSIWFMWSFMRTVWTWYWAE